MSTPAGDDQPETPSSAVKEKPSLVATSGYEKPTKQTSRLIPNCLGENEETPQEELHGYVQLKRMTLAALEAKDQQNDQNDSSLKDGDGDHFSILNQAVVHLGDGNCIVAELKTYSHRNIFPPSPSLALRNRRKDIWGGWSLREKNEREEAKADKDEKVKKEQKEAKKKARELARRAKETPSEKAVRIQREEAEEAKRAKKGRRSLAQYKATLKQGKVGVGSSSKEPGASGFPHGLHWAARVMGLSRIGLYLARPQFVKSHVSNFVDFRSVVAKDGHFRILETEDGPGRANILGFKEKDGRRINWFRFDDGYQKREWRKSIEEQLILFWEERKRTLAAFRRRQEAQDLDLLPSETTPPYVISHCQATVALACIHESKRRMASKAEEVSVEASSDSWSCASNLLLEMEGQLYDQILGIPQIWTVLRFVSNWLNCVMKELGEALVFNACTSEIQPTGTEGANNEDDSSNRQDDDDIESSTQPASSSSLHEDSGKEDASCSTFMPRYYWTRHELDQDNPWWDVEAQRLFLEQIKEDQKDEKSDGEAEKEGAEEQIKDPGEETGRGTCPGSSVSGSSASADPKKKKKTEGSPSKSMKARAKLSWCLKVVVFTQTGIEYFNNAIGSTRSPASESSCVGKLFGDIPVADLRIRLTQILKARECEATVELLVAFTKVCTLLSSSSKEEVAAFTLKASQLLERVTKGGGDDKDLYLDRMGWWEKIRREDQDDANDDGTQKVDGSGTNQSYDNDEDGVAAQMSLNGVICFTSAPTAFVNAPLNTLDQSGKKDSREECFELDSRPEVYCENLPSTIGVERLFVPNAAAAQLGKEKGKWFPAPPSSRRYEDSALPHTEQLGRGEGKQRPPLSTRTEPPERSSAPPGFSLGLIPTSNQVKQGDLQKNIKVRFLEIVVPKATYMS